ncbi:MAG: MFS transporter [Planctomycetes bacterium]|nr:MFS transporter [Planctomycetota bacterium]
MSNAESSPPESTERAGQPSNYGWLLLPLASLAMVGTLPGRTHGLGLINTPLMEDLGISVTTMGDINLWATLIGALFCLPCGWMIDRWGLRLSSTVVILSLAAVVMGMTYVTTAPQLFVAVTLTRGFGQSMLSLVSLAIVGKWFGERKLGLAMGLYSVLMSIGFAGAFQGVGTLTTNEGWRYSWWIVGLVLALGLAPLAALLARDPRPGASGKSSQAPSTSMGATFAQALTTPCFWVFAVSSSFFLVISSGISLYNQAILAERGFSRETFLDIASWSFLIGMAANLAGGGVARFFSLRWQLVLAMTLIAGSLVAFPYVDTYAELYVYTAIMAAAGGLMTVGFFMVWSQAFGQRELGKIQGAAQKMTVLASAVGPRILAEAHDRTGSFLNVYPYLAAVAALLALAAAFTPLARLADGNPSPAELTPAAPSPEAST